MRHNSLISMPNFNSTLAQTVDLILKFDSIILTTHKNSDGDGIGSAVAMYWALKELNKDVKILHVDPIPQRYSFLIQKTEAAPFVADHLSLKSNGLLMVLDTNQGSLCDPLYTQCKQMHYHTIFIDHHVDQTIFSNNETALINSEASSTGEIVYSILNLLKTKMTEDIAAAIYTSLTFDTQAFKLLRNSVRSHEIAAELAQKNIRTDFIQRELFATWTVAKLKFLAELISNAYFSDNQKIAGFKVSQHTLKHYHLNLDDISDVIDLFTLVKSVDFCYGLIENAENHYKISLRSINNALAFKVADALGGGGHANSAGAWVHGSAQDIEKKIHEIIQT